MPAEHPHKTTNVSLFIVQQWAGQHYRVLAGDIVVALVGGGLALLGELTNKRNPIIY